MLAKDFSSKMLPEIAALMVGVSFDVNMTSCSSGPTPLCHAALVGHEASVRLLLEGSPGINVKSTLDHWDGTASHHGTGCHPSQIDDLVCKSSDLCVTLKISGGT